MTKTSRKMRISGSWETCPTPALNCSRQLIASVPREVKRAWALQQSIERAYKLNHDFQFWSDQRQLPPEGDWLIWLFLGGRGAGKTRAGAEWVRELARSPNARLALVGSTFADVREVMIEGPSGVRQIGPQAERPIYESSRKRLVWPNGAVGYAFSAEDPDSLRGPQFTAAWGDEFAIWSQPQSALDMLRLGLRLGDQPRLLLTTTPRPIPALRGLIDKPGVVSTQRPTQANSDHLSPGFIAAMQSAYGGSRLGRQELDGELIDDPPGALWRRTALEACVLSSLPELDRIVIAIDPPVSAGPRSDECGIIAAGRQASDPMRAIVLADHSFGPARPAQWARRAIAAYETHQADRLVAEANQGGDMVASVLKTQAPDLPVKLVRASRGKQARAEPVAALYEAGRVSHAAAFPELVDQMCAFGAPDGGKTSPDRVDALVWALSELLLQRRGHPRLTRL